MLDFLGFVFLQIAAESLPISSSGHIQFFLELVKTGNTALFTALFLILQRSDVMFALHLPTVFIIAIFYLPRFLPVIYSFHKNIRVILKSVGYVVGANCFTVICYVGIKQSGFSIPLWIGFAITFLLLLSTYFKPPKFFVLDMKGFFVLGLVQGIAVLPGISRFAAVYAAGHWLGLSGRKAFDVAWMLQFPLILAAACVGWAQLIWQHEAELLLSPSCVWAMVLGTIVGFLGLYIMSFLAARNRLWIMALYIIIPLVISFWYGL
jgi:undecaprenyl-diphosphatase